jgi:hypothetical protein
MAAQKNKELFKNSPGPLAENFPPALPKFICQPKLFLNKLVLWSSNGMTSAQGCNHWPRETGLPPTEFNEEYRETGLCNDDCYCIQLLTITGWF